jgi:hypothetical protein
MAYRRARRDGRPESRNPGNVSKGSSHDTASTNGATMIATPDGTIALKKCALGA